MAYLLVPVCYLKPSCVRRSLFCLSHSNVACKVTKYPPLNLRCHVLQGDLETELLSMQNVIAPSLWATAATA
jgi:hypothetical protein